MGRRCLFSFQILINSFVHGKETEKKQKERNEKQDTIISLSPQNLLHFSQYHLSFTPHTQLRFRNYFLLSLTKDFESGMKKKVFMIFLVVWQRWRFALIGEGRWCSEVVSSVLQSPVVFRGGRILVFISLMNDIGSLMTNKYFSNYLS